MKNKILEIIQEKNDQSGGHCGVYVTEILQKLGVTYESIRVDLIDLYKERKITTHPSVHGQIIKINASNASK